MHISISAPTKFSMSITWQDLQHFQIFQGSRLLINTFKTIKINETKASKNFEYFHNIEKLRIASRATFEYSHNESSNDEIDFSAYTFRCEKRLYDEQHVSNFFFTILLTLTLVLLTFVCNHRLCYVEKKKKFNHYSNPGSDL